MTQESAMAACEVRGNEYDESFGVVRAGERHTFDSVECAIHLTASALPCMR